MAESGSRKAASDRTASQNIWKIGRDKDTPKPLDMKGALGLSDKLRKELSDKGMPGFKRGGKVKKTGPYKLHAGERVLTRQQQKNVRPVKPRNINKRK